MSAKRKLKLAHLLIIVAWLLPYLPLLEIRQIVTPLIVTLIFVVIDVVKSEGSREFGHYMIHVIWTNIVGMVFMTLEYEISNYAFWQDANFGPGMGLVFAGIWDVIYIVLLSVMIIMGLIAVKMKAK